jgi:hypothetical protein
MHVLFWLGITLLMATLAPELPYYISQLVSYPFQLLNGASVVEHFTQQNKLHCPKAKRHANSIMFDG